MAAVVFSSTARGCGTKGQERIVPAVFMDYVTCAMTRCRMTAQTVGHTALTGKCLKVHKFTA